VLNQATQRSIERFSDDFSFRLTRANAEALNQSQFVTGSQKHRDPHFTSTRSRSPSSATWRTSKSIPQ
jgi:hypothetical protein